MWTELTVKYFSLFIPVIVTVGLFCATNFYVRQPNLQLKELILAFCLVDIMCYSCTFI